MTTPFNLTALDEKSPLVLKLKKSLEGVTGQSAPFITVEKSKRISGISTRAIVFGLENGQTVGFLVHQDGDIYRVQLNEKELPLATDFDHSFDELFKQGMAEVGKAVRGHQKAFDKKQAMGKITIPKATPSNKVQTLTQKTKDSQALRDEITKAKEAAQAENVRLTAALALATGQANVVGK